MLDRAKLTYHSTARQAASIARLAGVDRLFLGHYSTRYKDPAPLLNEAREVFPESYLSQEGETIRLKE
jgi:ribonuclease Z